MWDDFDDDMAEFQRRKDDLNVHPLRTKSLEIFDLTHALVGSLDEARKELYGSLMLESAGILPSKFSATEGMDDYIIKMENAVMMKVHARSLHSLSYQLALEGTHAEEHLQLLRDAIQEFKILFKAWIQGFDKSGREDDGWGLFLD